MNIEEIEEDFQRVIYYYYKSIPGAFIPSVYRVIEIENSLMKEYGCKDHPNYCYRTVFQEFMK